MKKYLFGFVCLLFSVVNCFASDKQFVEIEQNVAVPKYKYVLFSSPYMGVGLYNLRYNFTVDAENSENSLIDCRIKFPKNLKVEYSSGKGIPRLELKDGGTVNGLTIYENENNKYCEFLIPQKSKGTGVVEFKLDISEEFKGKDIPIEFYFEHLQKPFWSRNTTGIVSGGSAVVSENTYGSYQVIREYFQKMKKEYSREKLNDSYKRFTLHIEDSNGLLSDRSALNNLSNPLYYGKAEAVGAIANVVKQVEKDIVKNVHKQVEKKITKDVYINNYGSFLDFVLNIDPLARSKFVNYFTDWQWSGQNEDFFTYSAERAEYEKKVKLCYDNAIEKFGKGTAIIAFPLVVSTIVPGGQIVQTFFLVIAKSIFFGAITGASIGSIVPGIKAISQGKSTEEIVYEAVNGAAEGYSFGAKAGLFAGTIRVFQIAKNAVNVKTVSDEMYIAYGKTLYDKSGKIIKDLSKLSDGAFKSTIHYIEKGHDINKVLEINFDQLYKFQLEVQNGGMTATNLWKKVKAHGWSKEICEADIKEQFNFGKYLRIKEAPPSGMIDAHAHHILPKTGHGFIQQKWVKKGQKILQSYGIDPILGSENLTWAPNRVIGQHSEKVVEDIVNGLENLQKAGATKGEIIDFLKVKGTEAAMR